VSTPNIKNEKPGKVCVGEDLVYLLLTPIPVGLGILNWLGLLTPTGVVALECE
jgi:hypothetical protein